MEPSTLVTSQSGQKNKPTMALGRIAGARRSVTVPARLQLDTDAQKPVEIGDSRGVETLYTHPEAKVVSFTAAPGSSNRRVSEGDGSGTLPWTTPAERTVATGPLEIYRIPGSVSFLHSGNLLHALMPRANCWCVDDASTFILKVSINTFYRIELPGTTEEELARVEEFKITLQKVLAYERTSCPFRRGFSVEVPETPSPPSRRRSRISAGPAKKWKLDGIWKPEDDEEWQPKYDRASVLSRVEGMITRGESSLKVRRQRPLSMAGRDESQPGSDEESDEETPRPKRPSSLPGMRSITAPPQLTLIASPPSKSSSRESSISKTDDDNGANGEILSAQQDDSYNYMEREGEAAFRKQTLQHIRKLDVDSNPGDHLSSNLRQAQIETLVDDNDAHSSISQTTEGGLMSEDDVVESRIWSGFSTPALSSDSEDHSWGEIVTPPETLRRRKSRKVPAVESLTRVSSSSTSSHRTSRESQTALTNGIVMKTCSIVLGPPAHLVSMMLKIAAKITRSAFMFTIHSPIDSPHTMPGSWYVGDEEDEWGLDDYGFPVGLQARVDMVRTMSNK